VVPQRMLRLVDVYCPPGSLPELFCFDVDDIEASFSKQRRL